MKTADDYTALRHEIEAIEARTGLYLFDENADQENSLDTTSYDTAEFWDLMYRSATNAVGIRAEEAGQNINTLIGRSIY